MRTAFVAWLFSLLPLVAAWRGAFLPGAWLVHLVLLPWLVLAAWPRLASGESGASGTPVGPQEGPRGHGIVAVTGWLALAAPGAVVAWAFDGAGSGTGAGAAIGAAIGAVTGEPGPGGASPGPWSAGGVVELVVSLALVVALVAVGELRGKRRSYPLLWAAWVPGFAGLVFALHGVGAGSDVAERGDAGASALLARAVDALADLHPFLWIWREGSPWFALLGAIVFWVLARSGSEAVAARAAEEEP